MYIYIYRHIYIYINSIQIINILCPVRVYFGSGTYIVSYNFSNIIIILFDPYVCVLKFKVVESRLFFILNSLARDFTIYYEIIFIGSDNCYPRSIADFTIQSHQ